MTPKKSVGNILANEFKQMKAAAKVYRVLNETSLFFIQSSNLIYTDITVQVDGCTTSRYSEIKSLKSPDRSRL
jgi:hypothetical protein